MISGKTLFLGMSFFYFYTLEAELRPLNILFVVKYFPSLSQIYVLNMISEFINRGHQVSIFSLYENKSHTYLHPSIVQHHLLDRVTYKKISKELCKSDIIFCQFGDVGKKIFEMPRMSRWLRTKKVVVCFRGFDLAAYVQRDPKVYKKLFKYADLFLPVCDYFKQKLIALGCPHQKIVVHHSAIDCSQFFFKERQKPENETIHLVSVCRLVKKKGIDYALKAFAQLIKKHPQLHYTIVGDGPEQGNLESLIQQLDISDYVTLCGWKSHNEIVSILNESHIFVLPSLTAPDGNEEGIANSLKEAMAMGLITVATWHAGTPELIDHSVSGLLVPEHNSDQLVYKIDYIIRHPELWKQMSLAARQKVENEFEITKNSEKLEQLFYEIL